MTTVTLMVVEVNDDFNDGVASLFACKRLGPNNKRGHAETGSMSST